MKKRVISAILTVLLITCILPATSFAAGTLSNFSKINTYTPGQFSDVSNQWFAPYVQAAYEYNLINGATSSTYAPNNNLTIAQAIKLAACLHSIYNTGAANFANGTPWYQPYVDYALENGIITAPYANYNAYATRADFAQIFAKALPAEALTAINHIDDNAIPDVSVGFSYGPAVYTLYRAGVLTGSGDTHAYKPNDTIMRSEVAAIAARMANPGSRVALTITSSVMSATEIASKCTPAVFYLELLSKTGTVIRSGSGFFISSSGLAVTNYHVIENMVSARITTKDGKTYDVAGIYDYSKANDLALIQINGSGFPYLDMGDSSAIQTGASIYAVGYPGGIAQTFTQGSVTNTSYLLDGVNYILIDASISAGSSGGALLNTRGQVIGVTSLYFSGTQNLNAAVPINLAKSLSSAKTLTPLAALFAKSFTYYASYPTVPDFSSVTGSQLYDQEYDYQDMTKYYIYSTNNLSGDIYDIRNSYLDQLVIEGFDYFECKDVDDYYFYYFNDPSGMWNVSVGIIWMNGAEYILVMIYPN